MPSRASSCAPSWTGSRSRPRPRRACSRSWTSARSHASPPAWPGTATRAPCSPAPATCWGASSLASPGRRGEDRAMIAHVALLVMALAPGANPATAYNQGNRLYAARDYAGAARAYEEALQAGPNPAVHFNLGNALFKTGKVGEAILHYRRARYLSPRDGDIGANLDFARAYRVDKTLTLPSPFARTLDRAFHLLARREAAWAAALLFTVGAALVSVWIVRRWTWVLVAACVCVAAALYGFVTERAWAAEIGERPAVVVVPEVSALSGPSEDSKQILLLHDGSEVTIRDARGDYLLVQLPGGGGWVPKGSVERVYTAP